MSNEKPTFETTANTAEEILENTEDSINAAMKCLDAKKYESVIHDFIENKTNEVIASAQLSLNKPTMSPSWKETIDALSENIPKILENFPLSFEATFIETLLAKKEWQDIVSKNSNDAETSFSFIVSVIGNEHKKRIESAVKDPAYADIPTFLTFNFQGGDLFSYPYEFGAMLPEYTVFTFNGDVGMWAGRNLQGGTITIHGNTKSFVGYEMKNGSITIDGNTGGETGANMEGGQIMVTLDAKERTGKNMKNGHITIGGNVGLWTGNGMEGGMLEISGEAESFAENAFSEENKGTIIWKNKKIWDDGDWTDIGREMNKQKEIPIGGIIV